MKSKIVENWLTKVTELTFTVPFCQLLLSEGKRVVHISSQGPGEQGKDIIAVDAGGAIHCYQLKCGNITSAAWARIKAEIDQLVELPPRHPSLEYDVTTWETYLVTNGNIANPTARDIYDYGESKASRGYPRLRTLTGQQLVAAFTNFYDEFIPVDVVDLQQFLELYNQHGDYELDVAKLKLFFEKFFNGRHASRQKKVEAIRASLVMCHYLLTNKYANENHLEVIKAYVLLLASIYSFAGREQLADSLWSDTERLAHEAVDIEFRRLIDEVIADERQFVRVEYGMLSEAATHKIRCSEVLGYLSAYVNSCDIAGVDVYKAKHLDDITPKLYHHRALLGECFVPFFVNYLTMLHRRGRDEAAIRGIVDLLTAIVERHRTDASRGLPSPYYGITESVNWMLGQGAQIREGFHRRSFTLRSVLLLAVRHELREELDYYWPVLSRISQDEVIPDRPIDALSWRVEKGRQVDIFPEMTGSWAQLVADATADYSVELPPVLRDRLHFLPLFINVMPHRLTHRLALNILGANQAVPKS